MTPSGPFPASPVPSGNPLEPAVATAELRVSKERVERAVICASGRVHYGPEYLHNDDPERVRTCAEAHVGQPWCGGGPHVIATRKIITTVWEPA